MLRIALFIDGFSRATLLSFAPLLLGHLMKSGPANVSDPLPQSMWPTVTWATAGMIVTYMVGRTAGNLIASQSSSVQRYYLSSQKSFSRTVGAVLALHLFSFGAGLKEPVSIFFMRFTMGFLVGLLLRVSSGRKEAFHDMRLEHIVETGIAKIWITGFAVSMLTGGVLYYPLSHSEIFTAMTGGGDASWSWLLSPIFFATIIQLTHTALQFCCGRFIQPQGYDHLCDDDEANDIVDTYDSYDSHDTFILGTPSKEGTSMHGTSVKRRVRLGSEGAGNRSRLGSQNRPRLNSRNRNRHGSYNRVRVDSSMSNDVFFDCESQCTNGSITMGFDDVPSSPVSPGRRALDNFQNTAKYENAKCVYEDGSPAHVQATLCAAQVPTAWKHIHKTKAEEAWEITKRWRMERKIWKIHSMPHSKFPLIKESYSHFVHGYSKMGYPVVYEKPGTMSLKARFTDGSITVDDMIHHYTFFMEFLSNTLSTRPEVRQVLANRPESCSQSHWGFIVVMDVSGLSLGILSGDVLRYLQQAGKVNTSHYPNSTTMALLVNTPFWLSSAFGTIKSILPENTQADILSSSNQLEGIRKYIDDDQIPKEFGGSSPYKLGEHPFEKELENLVENGLNKDFGDEDEECPLDEKQVHTTFDIPEEMKETVVFHEDTAFKDIELGQTSLPQNPDQMYPRSTFETSFEESASPSGHSISLRHGHRWTNAKYYAEEYVFMMISMMHCVWCAAQGSLETILPVWLLSPQILGGLGYEPRRSAFALFTASVVVMWLLRSKLARSIAYIPSNAPLRGFRIGVGAEAVLLLLLPFIPWVSNFDNMLVLTSNALICASMFIASFIGRKSSVKLHSVASSAYIEKLSLRCDTRTKIGQILNKIVYFVEKGGLSYYLGVLGEMTGALVVTPIVVWSMKKEHGFPTDASFSFYTGAALCASLYMSSFSFRVAGGVSNRYSERSECNHNAPMRCSILRDVIAVSVSDMASMFEENNWSSSTALGRQGGTHHMTRDDRKYVKKI